MSLLNKILPPPGTNPFFRSPGQAADVVTAPIRNMFGIPAVYEQIGDRIGNELKYAVKEAARGRMPYTVPTSAQATNMYGRYAPAATTGAQTLASFSSPPPTIGGAAAPAERAYQQEVSRVAQLTAQDPELQRYEAARAAAAKSGDQAQMNSARDIGMQMWAKANPTLAAKVKPGQSGYEAIQNQINAGQMGSPMELGAFAGAQPTDLLFNPSSPLRSAPQTGGTDYTQVVPAAMPGAGGVMGNYFNNQQQAKMFSRFQQAAPAQTGMNPGLAPGSPYAQATAAAGGATYAGAAGVQPVGSSLTQGANPFASEKARLQAEEFKKRALSMQQ